MAEQPNDNPQIRAKLIDELFKKLDTELVNYMKKHQDITNEELHLVLYRLEQLRIIQPTFHLYTQYISDLRKEESEKQAKKSGLYR